MIQTKSVSISTAQRDLTVGRLEKVLRDKPDAIDAAGILATILDWYQPSVRELGSYTVCQRMLSEKFSDHTWINDVLTPEKVPGHYKQWRSLLDSMGVAPRVRMLQLYVGKFLEIHGQTAQCDLQLSLFKKEGVIARICHDCFKVQILPTDLFSLVQVYFILRGMKLKRDNHRKCMVETRKDIPYPYKGYIFCESEEDATECLREFQQTLRTLRISGIYCGISHGCSEYGLKYPEFKYSKDGAHRTFERPANWDETEADFWSVTKLPKPGRKDYNKNSISIRDMIVFDTWLDYAEIIGDETWKMFRDQPSTNILERFATRVREQSQLRKTQIIELQQRLSIET